jgi:hypothetical protein
MEENENFGPNAAVFNPCAVVSMKEKAKRQWLKGIVIARAATGR